MSGGDEGQGDFERGGPEGRAQKIKADGVEFLLLWFTDIEGI